MARFRRAFWGWETAVQHLEQRPAFLTGTDHCIVDDGVHLQALLRGGGKPRHLLRAFVVPLPNIWRFSNMGVPPNHPLATFVSINHPFLKAPYFGKRPFILLARWFDQRSFGRFSCQPHQLRKRHLAAQQAPRKHHARDYSSARRRVVVPGRNAAPSGTAWILSTEQFNSSQIRTPSSPSSGFRCGLIIHCLAMFSGRRMRPNCR